ncbi:hypothetical protein [Lactiplantibacillus plantarum]|uniref:hypothetical protein n=1 Tax=Lactiplantibacillus plantarum TaxID=1590 RepID=UPI001B833080|nr:hypothetical protein [Lactiplantibacillus plantarum]GIQ95202.1 hypothetical protein COY2906_20720 [Lactiplantibacillus plantarum]
MNNIQLYKVVLVPYATQTSGIPTWVGTILGPLIGFLGVALTAYMVRRNMKTQIEAELSRIRDQYEYDQKRDNNNFVNKLLLEKLSDLYSALNTWYAEDNYNVIKDFYFEVLEYSRNTEYKPDQAKKAYNKSGGYKNRFSPEVYKLLAFYPDIKSEFDSLARTLFQIKVIKMYEVMDKWEKNKLTVAEAKQFLKEVDDTATLNDRLTQEVSDKISSMMSELQK